MRARVPLDVDLEDKLVYGLTPTRFGYLVVAALAAFGIWTGWQAPELLRASVAGCLLAGGAALAWGRLGGRSIDQLIADALLFAKRNLRFGRTGRVARVPAAARAAGEEVAVLGQETLPVEAPDPDGQVVVVVTGEAAHSLRAAMLGWPPLPADVMLDRLRQSGPGAVAGAPSG